MYALRLYISEHSSEEITAGSNIVGSIKFTVTVTSAVLKKLGHPFRAPNTRDYLNIPLLCHCNNLSTLLRVALHYGSEYTPIARRERYNARRFSTI